MDPAELAHELVELGRAAGLAAVGFAGVEPFDDTRVEIERRVEHGLHAGMAFTFRNPARSTTPASALPGAATLVVGALAYPARVDPPTGSVPGRVSRVAAADTYAVLREALGVVAACLRGHGHRARVLADDNALVDRAAAHRAGLGWWGRSSMVLVTGHGPWVVLGSVLTDAVLPPGDPVPDGCGACRRCLDACPTGAIVAPGVVDARRCLAALVQADGTFPEQWRQALGNRLYGCDDCTEVCPPGRPAMRRDAEPAAVWVDVVEVLTATDGELLDRFARWYVPRRDPAVLRRNALVVLGNQAVAAEVARPLLAQHLAHPSAMVREHAGWAARQLGHDDLLDAVG